MVFLIALVLLGRFIDKIVLKRYLDSYPPIYGVNVRLHGNTCVLLLQAPFYKLLSQVIKLGCQGAVWASERI